MENKRTACKLLLIDDDVDDRRYFMEAVSEIDDSIECVMAKDGKQALTLLHDEKSSLPDYIFLDLRMPKINGRQCLLQLKADTRLKDIPVIVYTASREVEEAEQLQLIGAAHFISKPANTDEIYYIVSQVLEEQGYYHL